MRKKLADSTKISVNKQAFSCILDDEVVVLGIKDGVYYGLDSTGSFIWNLIQEPIKIGEIRDAILEKYEVEKEICEADLLSFLQDLLEKGLLEVRE